MALVVHLRPHSLIFISVKRKNHLARHYQRGPKMGFLPLLDFPSAPLPSRILLPTRSVHFYLLKLSSLWVESLLYKILYIIKLISQYCQIVILSHTRQNLVNPHESLTAYIPSASSSTPDLAALKLLFQRFITILLLASNTQTLPRSSSVNNRRNYWENDIEIIA